MEMYLNQVKASGRVRSSLRAEHAARCHLAQLQAVGYEGLSARNSPESSESPDALFGDSIMRESDLGGNPDLGDRLWWNAQVEKVAAGPQPARLRIVVTVMWGKRPDENPKPEDVESRSRKVIGYVVAP